MSKPKFLAALVVFSLLFISGSVHAEGGGSYVKVEMLALNMTVLPGSGDAIAVVHAKMYEWVPVFDRFNFSELNRYNLTDVVWDTVYIFYLNSSGAYLLYKGDEKGVPEILHSEKQRTWYFRFHLGELNPLFTAFLRSKGYNVSRSSLKGYLAFNGSLVWAVSKLPSDATTTPGYPYVRGIRVDKHYLANFSISYVNVAYGADRVQYSWTVQGKIVNESLGLSAPVLTMAVPNLINCTEGTFKGEEYCFPEDKPKWMYLYYDNLRVLYYGNGSWGEVYHWNRTMLMPWTRWDELTGGKVPSNRTVHLMGEELIPLNSMAGFSEYGVAFYNFTANRIRTFPLLKISKNPSTLEPTSDVKIFRPVFSPVGNQSSETESALGTIQPSPATLPERVALGNALIGIVLGLITGAIIGYLLGRRR